MMRIGHKKTVLSIIVCCLLCLLPASFLSAYVWEKPGQAQNRKIDERKVGFFVSIDGNDLNDGKTRKTPFATIQKAVDMMQPGDTVLVTRGIYKKGFHVNKEGREGAWLSIVAEPGAEIRGSEVRKDWKPVVGMKNVWYITRPNLLSNYQQTNTELPSRTEQVFVGGVILRQVPERAMLKPKGTFFVDDVEKKLYACLAGGKNPNIETTEVSMLTWAIAIGGPPNMNWWDNEKIGLENKAAYVRIDGFTVRHIAGFSRMAAVQIRGICHDIIIENCDVQWSNWSGIAAASMWLERKETGLKIRHTCERVVIRHNIASNNGCQGIAAGRVSYLTVEHNITDNNNYKGISPWQEGGAVKLGFEGHHIIIRGNLARNNDNHGLWLDNGATDCIFENNFVFSSVAGGILNECTPLNTAPDGNVTEEYVRGLNKKGSVIRNNIILSTRVPGGGGINVSSSSFDSISNNILAFNQGGAINYSASSRADAEGLRDCVAHGNIAYMNFLHAEIGWEPKTLKDRLVFGNVLRDNLFIAATADVPFKINGLPVTAAAAEKYDSNGTTITGNVYSDKKIFKDPEHWDFTITDSKLAKKIGFNVNGLRLDWSEFWTKPSEVATKKLAITGGNDQAAGVAAAKAPYAIGRIFHLDYDGNIDAVGSAGKEIEAQNMNRVAFNSGKFVSGVKGKAFVPNKVIYYVPLDAMPVKGHGAISLWLKADDWTTEERIKRYKKDDYTLVMTPFSGGNPPKRWAPWAITFQVDKGNFKTLRTEVILSGNDSKMQDVTKRIKPGEWFNYFVSWSEIEGTATVYIDAMPFCTFKIGKVDQFEKESPLYIGVPKNGGQPWVGAMDELNVWDHAFSADEVRKYVKALREESKQ